MGRPLFRQWEYFVEHDKQGPCFQEAYTLQGGINNKQVNKHTNIRQYQVLWWTYIKVRDRQGSPLWGAGIHVDFLMQEGANRAKIWEDIPGSRSCACGNKLGA